MIKLTKQTLYEGDSPDALRRQLGTFEQNVGEAIRQLDARALPVFKPTRRDGTYNVPLGEFSIVDTTAAAGVAYLPVSTPQNGGRCVALMKTSASFTLTAAVTEGTVSGATSEALSTAGKLYLFMSDGAGGWWRTD